MAIVTYDQKTGAPTSVTGDTSTQLGKTALSQMAPTTVNQNLSTANINDPMASDPKVSPDDKPLLEMGVTPEQLAQLNTPEGMDPGDFQSLIGNVENRLKTNNDLVTQRGFLIKQLYDSPLSKEQLKQLPQEIQDVVKTGDKDTIELQIRLLNDQISGRANTLSQSIKYLADGYETSVLQSEKQKDDAISTVLQFVDAYGSKAPSVLKSLYGEEYLAKLKAMGIDIEGMSSISTLAQDREARLAADGDGDGDSTDAGLTPTQSNKGSVNAGLSAGDFKKLPADVQKFYAFAGADDLASIKDTLANLKSGSLTIEEANDYVDGLGISADVKEHFKTLFKGGAPAVVAKAPSVRYNPFSSPIKGGVTNFFSNVKSGFNYLIGK